MPRRSLEEEYALARLRKGLSLRQLIRFTPRYFIEKSRDVVVKKYNPRARSKGGFPAIAGVLLTVDGNKHYPKKVSIVGVDKNQPKLSKQEKVIVSCSCENWMYVWEYALTQWGSANIVYSNGEPASFTNPHNVPGVCKHIIKLSKLIIEQGD